MSDDFERAILIHFNPLVDAELKVRGRAGHGCVWAWWLSVRNCAHCCTNTRTHSTPNQAWKCTYVCCMQCRCTHTRTAARRGMNGHVGSHQLMDGALYTAMLALHLRATAEALLYQHTNTDTHGCSLICSALPDCCTQAKSSTADHLIARFLLCFCCSGPRQLLCGRDQEVS